MDAPINPGYLHFRTKIIITILDCDVDLTSQGPTEQVTDGFICLSGSEIPSCFSRKQDNQFEYLDISLNLQCVIFRGRIFEDVYLGTQLDYAGVFCLPVSIRCETWVKDIWTLRCEGLVLELVSPGRNLYKRLGMFGVRNDDNDGNRSWLDRDWKAGEQRITLICKKRSLWLSLDVGNPGKRRANRSNTATLECPIAHFHDSLISTRLWPRGPQNR